MTAIRICRYCLCGLVIGYISPIGQAPGNANDVSSAIENLTFGFRFRGSSKNVKGEKKYDLLICDPIYKSKNNFSMEEMNKGLVREFDQYLDSFVPLKESFISEFIEDSVGDTVMMVWSSGKFRALIVQIGFYADVCDNGLACKLSPIEKSPRLPGVMDSYIVFRSGSFYQGPVMTFREISISDRGFAAIEDSISELLSQSWLAERLNSSSGYTRQLDQDSVLNQCQGNIKVYGSSLVERPDTLFLSVNCSLGYESDWRAVYQIIRSGNRWRIIPLEDPGRGEYSTNFLFAFDLNGDGTLEYFVQKGYYEGWGPAIYSFTDGEWMLIIADYYGGC